MAINDIEDRPGVEAPGSVAKAPWLANYPENIDWHAEFTPRPFQSLLDEAAVRYADNPCIDFLDQRLTYKQVDARAAKLAKGLQSLGVKKGMKVGLFLPNCPLSIIGFFAILRAGGTVVNYNPLYVTREIEHQVLDSETDIMITLDLEALLPKLTPLLSSTRLKAIIVGKMADCLPFPKNLLYPWVKRRDVAEVPEEPAFVRLSTLMDNDGGFTPVPVEPEQDIALIQYTGGTTGVSKGAVHSHASLVINADQLLAWTPGIIDGGESILGVIPLFHVLAVSTVLTYGVRSGAMMILLPRFDIDQMLATIHKKRPTFLPGVPTMYNAISSHPSIDRFDLTSIKCCISGGAPLPIEVKENFERRAGCSLVEGYGLTEAPVTHCNPFWGLQKTGSFGVPMPGTEIEIVSLEDGKTVLPPGEKGEICLKGPQVMQGYWQKPEATAATIREGWLHTGDIGYLDEDGYGFLVDRLKELIICSGYNVYPRAVEEALYEHPEIIEAAVIGVPDDYRGETVKA
ncbi:MAG: long-chain fatty acid--CoA ligase, partial [Alphaproteobacteria bacterium]|nr:long-chain fatty acid--CoA ligase [Alphaproteobacteria bacterium]